MNEWMNGSWDAYLASSADFAGVDDIITNLAKERDQDHQTHSPIFDYYQTLYSIIINSRAVIKSRNP